MPNSLKADVQLKLEKFFFAFIALAYHALAAIRDHLPDARHGFLQHIHRSRVGQA